MDGNASSHEQFIDMLIKFASMWDEHIEQINIAKRGIELTPGNTQLIHSKPYRAKPKAQDFVKRQRSKTAVAKGQ